jgi:hypothetical protein
MTIEVTAPFSANKQQINIKKLPMKKTMLQLLAILTIVATTQAAPVLNLATVISKKQADGKFQVLASPKFIVESSKSACININTNEIELAVTPTLNNDGSVIIKFVLTINMDGKKADMDSKILTPLGKSAQLQVGNLQLKVTPTTVSTN